MKTAQKTITRRDFIAIALAAIATAATPRTAHAIPQQFRKCPRITQNGILYILSGRDAIVVKCPARQSVTIPHTVRHSGKTYTTTAVWAGAVSPKTTRIALKARDLDTIEDARIWSGKVLVICSDKDTRAWLKKGGAKVK